MACGGNKRPPLMSEFDWIAWLKNAARQKLPARPDVLLGIGDDAALCDVPFCPTGVQRPAGTAR